MVVREKNSGFTLVEVVLVLTVMGLLATAVLPKILNIIGLGKKGSRDNIVAAVKSGLQLQKLATISDTNVTGSYPTNLDVNPGGGATCAVTACFDNVLEAGQAVKDSKWVKIDNAGPLYHYDFDPGPDVSHFEYSAANGTFICTSGAC